MSLGDESIANLIKINLSAEGYQCTCAYDGKAGADYIEREAFDLSREKIIEKVNIDNQDIANHFDISKSQKIINIEGDKHNALYDAKVIKEIYEIVN